MGLFWRELLPPPASAQLPVLGKRLWLLQTRGGHAGHRQTAPPVPRELTSLQASIWVLDSHPPSLRSPLCFSAFPPEVGRGPCP